MKTRFRPPSDCVFPPNSLWNQEKFVTPQMLATAKPYARQIVIRHAKRLQRHFSRYAMRKYRCKPSQVSFDNTVPLLQKAKLVPLSEEVVGETDGVEICINSIVPMTWDHLVSTLVHESLHNFCRVRGRFMSCHNEHQCMRGLGEP